MRHWETTGNSNLSAKPEMLISLELGQHRNSSGESVVVDHSELGGLIQCPQTIATTTDNGKW